MEQGERVPAAGPRWEIYGDPDPSTGDFDVAVFWSLVRRNLDISGIWLAARRRLLARDCERDLTTSEVMIRWAAITTMTSRIARGEPAARQQRWHWPGES